MLLSIPVIYKWKGKKKPHKQTLFFFFRIIYIHLYDWAIVLLIFLITVDKTSQTFFPQN